MTNEQIEEYARMRREANELFQASISDQESGMPPHDSDDEVARQFEEERAARLRSIAEALSGEGGTREVEPYGGVFGFFPALGVGVVEGIPSLVGGLLSGAGIYVEGGGPLRTNLIPGADDLIWEVVGKAMQKGGNWIQDNVSLLPEEQRLRLQATMANVFFEDDGQPAWKMGSWVTGADGEWNLGRRMTQVAAKAGAGIGQTLPLIASMYAPGGALRLLGASQKVAAIGGAAMNLGGMVALQANEGMRQLENKGYDTDILKDAAIQYGLTSGPVEYVQNLLSSKLMRGAFEKAAGQNVGKSIADTVERFLSEKSRLGAVKAAGLEGAEEVTQGWLINPAIDYATSKMRERYGDDWKPNDDARFTLKDATESGMMGAAMGGFFRGVGKTKDMLLSNAKTRQQAQAQQAAPKWPVPPPLPKGPVPPPTPNATVPPPLPVDQAARDSLSRGHNGPVTMTESDFDSVMKSVLLGAETGELGNANGDHTEYATLQAAWEWAIGSAEGKSKARKIYSDALNISIIPDKLTGEQAQQVNEEAITRRNTDQSRAMSFLSDDTVREPSGITQSIAVAPDVNRVNSYKKEISYDAAATPERDVIARDALGIPVRTDGALHPTEVKAIVEYRRLLERAKMLKVSVRKLISRHVSMTDKDAKKFGVDTESTQRDGTGRLVVKIVPTIGMSGGNPVLTLPADFTLAELRHGVMMASTHPELATTQLASAVPIEAKKWNDTTHASVMSEYVSEYGNGVTSVSRKTPDEKAWTERKGAKLNQLLRAMGDTATALEVANIAGQLDKGTTTAADANTRLDVIASKKLGELDVDSARRFNRLFKSGGGRAGATKNIRSAFAYAIANPKHTPKMFAVDEAEAPSSVTTAEVVLGKRVDPAEVKAPVQAETAKKGGDATLEDAATESDANSEADAVVNMATEAIEEVAGTSKTDEDIEKLSRAVEEEKEEVSGEQPRGQTVTIRTPANAENFVSRLFDVVERMGGTTTMNEDGSVTARFGAYEVTAKPSSEQITSDGKKANAVIATTRDVHTNEIVGWQITYDAESTVSTTAAHEILHAVVDLLSVDERNTLAGMFGVSSIKGQNEEIVVEKMAQAIANDEAFGEQRSAAQIIWDKVKSTLNMMLHLRFGAAWDNVKSLPVEMRNAAVTRLISSGEVFRRADAATASSDIRYQTFEDRRDDAAVRRKIKAEDEAEGLMNEYEATRPLSDAIAKLKKDMADIKAKSFDKMAQVLEDAELQRYMDVMDYESLKDKMAAAKDKSQAVKDKLVARIQELKARAIIAKIVPDMIALKVGAKSSNLATLEDISTRGVYDPVLEQYYDAMAAGNEITKDSVKTVKDAFLKAINEVMLASGMSDYMFKRVNAADMTLEQLSALELGLLDGISAKLKQYWKATAKAESRTYGVKITSPKGLDLITIQDYDVNKQEILSPANTAWDRVVEKTKKGKRDWSEWKDIATDLKTIKQAEIEYLKQQKEAAKAEREAIEDQIIAEGKNNLGGKKFGEGLLKYGLVKFEMMKSTLGRVSPLLKKIFHDDIVAGWDKATALIRGSESAGMIYFEGERIRSGINTQGKESEAALTQIPIRIHGEDVGMTLNQKHMLLALLTDVQRLLVIRQGTDVNLSHEENSSEALSVFKPRNAKTLTWYNLKDRGAAQITLPANTRPDANGLWINVETQQGIADFLASVTEQDAVVAAANKIGNVQIMAAVNETYQKEYGTTKFETKAFPNKDAKAQAFLQALVSKYRRGAGIVLPKFTFGYTTSRRARTSADAKKFTIGADRAAMALEELGVQGKRTARYLETPLVIDDIVLATRRNYSQLARIAKMQVPMRKAINHLTDIDQRKKQSLKAYLTDTFGQEFIDKDLTGWLQDQIGLSGQSTESTARFMTTIARNIIVGRLALRPSSIFVNRYSSGFITSAVLSNMETEGRIPKGSSTSFLKHLAVSAPVSIKSEESQDILNRLMNDADTGYFWKRWASDMAKVYAQANFDEENVVPKKWAMFTNNWQTKAMSVFALAEKQKAIALYRTLKEAGVSDSKVVKLVEDVYRSSENPSTKAEESPILRWMKESNISWLAPYVGQTLVTRDILTNAIMQLATAGTDSAKRANAKKAIIASSVGIIATMAASEAFRMMIRKVIKPEPEDEERERAKKIAMNLLQESAATVAPFAGDAAALSLGQMFGLAEKQFADTSMIASVMDDIMSTLPVLGDSVRMVTGTEEEGNEKELKDLAKGAWKAIVAITTASGLATAGGIDQAGKAIIEYGFPTTKEEAGKRRAVEVMDDVSENTTREEFDMMLRDEYNEAIDEGYIDKKKTSFKEFRGAMRRRVEKKLGEEKALELGYKKRKKEKGDGEEG